MKLAEDASNYQGLLQDSCVRPCSALSMLTMGAWCCQGCVRGGLGLHCAHRAFIAVSALAAASRLNSWGPGLETIERPEGSSRNSLGSHQLHPSTRNGNETELAPEAAFGICGLPFAQALARTGNCSQLTIYGQFPTWVGDWQVPLACWPARCTMLGLRRGLFLASAPRGARRCTGTGPNTQRPYLARGLAVNPAESETDGSSR
jgi:hypothetical protein